MDTAEVVLGDYGRSISPLGVTSRIPVGYVVPMREESDEERQARLEEFFEETQVAPKDVPVRKLCTCDGDQLVAKRRRVGIFQDDEPGVE